MSVAVSASQSKAGVQRKLESAAEQKPSNVQLKKELGGMDYASGAARLAPGNGDVQKKDAKSTGAWTLEELGTADQADAKKGGGQQDDATKKGAAPLGPSVEQIVQDAYTLGGKSRYQVTPEEAIKWVEDMARNARPEHKYAFQEAIKRINKRL